MQTLAVVYAGVAAGVICVWTGVGIGPDFIGQIHELPLSVDNPVDKKAGLCTDGDHHRPWRSDRETPIGSVPRRVRDRPDTLY